MSVGPKMNGFASGKEDLAGYPRIDDGARRRLEIK